MGQAVGGFGIFVLIVIAFIAIAIVSTFIGHRYERKRTDELQELARSMGLEFRPDLDDGLRATLSGLPLFAEASSRTIRNLMYGSDGTTGTMIFDYKHKTGTGKNSQTSNYTIVLVHSPQLHLPKFSLQPEHFGHRLLATFGFQDINFSDHPQFSRSYLPREPEEQVRAVFHDEVITWFEGQPNLIAQGNDQDLAVTRPKLGKTPSARYASCSKRAFRSSACCGRGETATPESPF